MIALAVRTREAAVPIEAPPNLDLLPLWQRGAKLSETCAALVWLPSPGAASEGLSHDRVLLVWNYLVRWRPPWLTGTTILLALPSTVECINAIRSRLGASLGFRQIDGRGHVLSYPALWTVWWFPVQNLG